MNKIVIVLVTALSLSGCGFAGMHAVSNIVNGVTKEETKNKDLKKEEAVKENKEK